MKAKYLKLLKENKGKLNELELGEKLGLNYDETQLIIAEILSENRLEYGINNAANYRFRSKRNIKISQSKYG